MTPFIFLPNNRNLTAGQVYARIRYGGQYFNKNSSQFQTVTLTSGNVTNYSVPCEGDFDGVGFYPCPTSFLGTGEYEYVFYLRLGASPALTDTIVGLKIEFFQKYSELSTISETAIAYPATEFFRFNHCNTNIDSNDDIVMTLVQMSTEDGSLYQNFGVGGGLSIRLQVFKNGQEILGSSVVYWDDSENNTGFIPVNNSGGTNIPINLRSAQPLITVPTDFGNNLLVTYTPLNAVVGDTFSMIATLTINQDQFNTASPLVTVTSGKIDATSHRNVKLLNGWEVGLLPGQWTYLEGRNSIQTNPETAEDSWTYPLTSGTNIVPPSLLISGGHNVINVGKNPNGSRISLTKHSGSTMGGVHWHGIMSMNAQLGVVKTNEIDYYLVWIENGSGVDFQGNFSFKIRVPTTVNPTTLTGILHVNTDNDTYEIEYTLEASKCFSIATYDIFAYPCDNGFFVSLFIDGVEIPGNSFTLSEFESSSNFQEFTKVSIGIVPVNGTISTLPGGYGIQIFEWTLKTANKEGLFFNEILQGRAAFYSYCKRQMSATRGYQTYLTAPEYQYPDDAGELRLQTSMVGGGQKPTSIKFVESQETVGLSNWQGKYHTSYPKTKSVKAVASWSDGFTIESPPIKCINELPIGWNRSQIALTTTQEYTSVWAVMFREDEPNQYSIWSYQVGQWIGGNFLDTSGLHPEYHGAELSENHTAYNLFSYIFPANAFDENQSIVNNQAADSTPPIHIAFYSDRQFANLIDVKAVKIYKSGNNEDFHWFEPLEEVILPSSAPTSGGAGFVYLEGPIAVSTGYCSCVGGCDSGKTIIPIGQTTPLPLRFTHGEGACVEAVPLSETLTATLLDSAGVAWTDGNNATTDTPLVNVVNAGMGLVHVTLPTAFVSAARRGYTLVFTEATLSGNKIYRVKLEVS